MMMAPDDHVLLHQFVRDQSQDAFTQLTHRYLGLVYSAALRHARSHSLAEEIAQSTFADLARQAPSLPPSTVLPAWLYRVARSTAIDVVRRETRRQRREQVAAETKLLETQMNEWTSIEPLLDEALEVLDEKDRNAILLRFFENRSLREVGLALSLGEDAAQKRVSRAVEQLRRFFADHGVSVGSAALATAISNHAAAAAPSTLAASLPLAALHLAQQVATPTAAAAIEATAFTLFQKLAAAAAISLSLAIPALTAHRIQHTLRLQNDHIQAQHAQLQQLRQQIRSLASLLDQLEQQPILPAVPTPTLMRLRNLVTRLNRDVNSLRPPSDSPPDHTHSLASVAAIWAERATQLKQMMNETPASLIPELGMLADKDWVDAIHPLTLNGEEEVRRAMSNVRANAEGRVLSLLRSALSRYSRANGGQMPASIPELAPYLKTPVAPEILARYHIVPSRSLIDELQTGDPWLITQKAPVDPEWDVRESVGLRLGRFADSRITNRWNTVPNP